ncbi:MFS transporter [Bradyrhizobium sp. 26S5]|uniref:MFS transporter n=1 Tax=Bradyrhizobium sp. 26S5 TaxID=3139729 RepID=UPI0030CF2E6F
MTKMAREGASTSRLRVILAASIGSALEWYDFFLYGTAAALVFGELFFPKSDPVVGTLLSFLTFGVGFVVRPFGGLVFGILGDRYGRKPVLVATLLMIGIGTTAIGLLPTYAQIGVWAPILLVAMRVIQGLGAGAEYGGAVIYLVENAPPKHRGFWGGFAPLGVSVGNLLAAAAFALVTMLPREDLMSWGWRLPFLASFLLIVVGIFVRMRITETPVYTEAVVARGKVESNPAMEALRRHPRNFFVVLGARMAENGLGYFFPVFGLSYVITTLGVPKADALSALMLAFTVELFAILGFAALSDRIGRRPVYMFGALAGVALAFPFFWMVGTKQWIMIALAFILARRGDGGDVRAAGGVFRRTVPAATPLRRLRLRARARFAAVGRPGTVRRHRAGGCLRHLVAGRLLRDVPVGLHGGCDLDRARDLSGEHCRRRERTSRAARGAPRASLIGGAATACPAVALGDGATAGR